MTELGDDRSDARYLTSPQGKLLLSTVSDSTTAEIPIDHDQIVVLHSVQNTWFNFGQVRFDASATETFDGTD